MRTAEFEEGQYDYRIYGLRGESFSPHIGRVYSAFDSLPRGSWVLDLGSGSGRFVLKAPKFRHWYVLGIEQNPHAVVQLQTAIVNQRINDEVRLGDIKDLGGLTGEREFNGALSWRVLHTLDPHEQAQVLEQVANYLPVGAPLFLAVASDKDWKASALREQRVYVEEGFNDCTALMQTDRPFKVDFFHSGRIERLAAGSGFEVLAVEDFEEATGYEHLKAVHPNNAYLFAHLVKG